MKFGYAEYALLFKALSDETRLKIFHMLSKTELCACDILEEVNISQSTLSYHMKSLTESGLVIPVKSGLWTNYKLNKKQVKELETFIREIANSNPIPLEKNNKCQKENSYAKKNA